ncbi:MAG: sigma-70 family RNA polymerase sigma factor [Bacilli bacterium]|jgi:RNA polymerase sigma-70 factor (ECF subfamily)|nr:sigma-70 family RNA polymerase sigma factor [Bacilli bacterium]
MGHPTDEHFTEIYNSCSRDVFRASFSYLQSSEDSENVLQDVFMEYFERPPKDERNIKSWLVSKAIHRSLDVLRKRKKEIEIQRESAYETKSEVDKESKGELEEALNLIADLPKKCKSAIVLFYMDEMSIETISKSLAISENAVKKRLERGRKILKGKMKNGNC